MKKAHRRRAHAAVSYALIALTGFILAIMVWKAEMQAAMFDEYALHEEAMVLSALR